MEDLKERLVRAEQNHLNLKENFTEFKAEVQGEFVSLTKKMDEMMSEVSGIKLVIAKWLGAGGAIMVIVQFVADKVFK